MKNWRCVDGEEDDSENSQRKFVENQRTQRENNVGETETRNVKRKCWRLQKRDKAQGNKGHKDINGEFNVYIPRVTFNSQTRFLYYTNKAKPVGRSYLALNAECECEVKDK